MGEIIGIFLSLGAALSGAIAVVYNKCLADNMHWSVVNFYYISSNCLICPIWSFLIQRSTYPIYNSYMFAHIICIGITFSLVMTLMTVSIKMMSASLAGILFYLVVCFAYLLDYFYLGTRIGWMEILGAAIIVGANVTISILIAFKIVK